MSEMQRMKEPGIVCYHAVDMIMTGDVQKDAADLNDTVMKIVRSILDEHITDGLRGVRIGWTTAPLSLYEEITSPDGISIWRLKEGIDENAHAEV